MTFVEYDSTVSTKAFGRIVRDFGPLPGDVFPECPGVAIARTDVQADFASNLEYPSGS